MKIKIFASYNPMELEVEYDTWYRGGRDGSIHFKVVETKFFVTQFVPDQFPVSAPQDKYYYLVRYYDGSST